MTIQGVNVALGSLRTRVAEHELHLEESGSTALEIGAEGVAKRVGIEIIEAGAAKNAAEMITEMISLGGDGGKGSPDVISNPVFV